MARRPADRLAAATRSIAGEGKPAASAGGRSHRSGRVTSARHRLGDHLERAARPDREATGEQAALVGPRRPDHRRRSRSRPRALPESGETATLDVEGGELRVAATEPLGTSRFGSRCSRPPRRRGLPLLAAEDRDRARRLPALAALIAVGFAAALAPGPDPRDARRRAADRRRRLQRRGAGQRQRRDGRAGERVQQDERPARRADGPAAPPAGRDREVGAADRRGVRLRASTARRCSRSSSRRPSAPARPTTGWSRSAAMSAPRPRPGPATERVQEAALRRRAAGAARGRPGRGRSRTAPTRSRARSGGSARPRRRSGR